MTVVRQIGVLTYDLGGKMDSIDLMHNERGWTEVNTMLILCCLICG